MIAALFLLVTRDITTGLEDDERLVLISLPAELDFSEVIGDEVLCCILF